MYDSLATKKFEHIGYLKEYYVGTKFIGAVKTDVKDRETVGYDGRITEVLTADVITDNKIKIKAGTEVRTMLYPLSGKYIRE